MKKIEIKKLDTEWSKKVKELAKYRCEHCLEEDVWLNSCHIVGRRYRATRWGAWIDGKYDLCGWCGCYTHHNSYDEHGPLEGAIKRKVIGLVRFEAIRKIAEGKVAKGQVYEDIREWIKNA